MLCDDALVDSAGILHGTSGTFEDSGQYGRAFTLLAPYQEQLLIQFAGDDFRDLEVAASGNSYGMTGSCESSQGTVWLLSPRTVVTFRCVAHH